MKGRSRALEIPEELAFRLDDAAEKGPATSLSATANILLSLWFLKLQTFREIPTIGHYPREAQRAFYLSPRVYDKVKLIADATGETIGSVIIEGLRSGLQLFDQLDLEYVEDYANKEQEFQFS